MTGVNAPLILTIADKGINAELIIPEEFVKDFYIYKGSEVMIMLRIVGTDAKKVKSFFENSEKELFIIETVESIHNKKFKENMILSSIYMDEGPNLSVDINSDTPLLRLILDFNKEK